MHENRFEEILESFINGNITWARNEVSSMCKEDFVEFNIFLLDMVDEDVITRTQLRSLLTPSGCDPAEFIANAQMKAWESMN